MPRQLSALLVRIKKRGTDIGYVLHINQRQIGDIKRGFKVACDEAGLQGITPHTLRHTAITWMLQRGVSMWDVSGYFNVSMETIEKVYGHHCPDYMNSAIMSFKRNTAPNTAPNLQRGA
jgi:integrase